MTQVDFYLVHHRQRESFVCRLVQKAFALGNDVFVHTSSQADAHHIDDLLWTFQQGSFVPHEIVTQATPLSDACPVLLGYGAEPQGKRSVLVNMDNEVPVFFSRFERVLEVLGDDDTQRAAARTRYSFYRDRGYPLEYHKVSA
ncbi:MAG: DNA polymerase III subunit chi [Gammaproteobacteria bacterium]|nr:DNA polymerase III subunit chi [Gammaproteobacteria bacterium]